MNIGLNPGPRARTVKPGPRHLRTRPDPGQNRLDPHKGIPSGRHASAHQPVPRHALKKESTVILKK